MSLRHRNRDLFLHSYLSYVLPELVNKAIDLRGTIKNHACNPKTKSNRLLKINRNATSLTIIKSLHT